MSETSEKPSNPRDETARDLAHALNEAALARLRFQKRTSVIGDHGENFDQRAARSERIVQKFNENVVKNARKNALRAGWTAEQLASSGLIDAEYGPGSALA